MITMLPRSKLEPHPDNPRKDLGDMTELAASIKRSGVLQNLTVVPSPDHPDMYRIVIGHRRHAAAGLAGVDELPCAIDETMTYADQISTMLAENMQRNDLTIADQVSGIQMMMDLGESVKTIAAKTGMSETSVRKRATIAALPKAEMLLAASKGATLIDLLDVTQLESPEAQAKVLADFGTNNFAYTVRVAKDEERRKKFRDAIMPEIQAKFPKITELPDSEKYSGRWEEIWRAVHRDEERKPIPEPVKGDKYRFSEWSFGIALYQETKGWAERKAHEKDFNAWMRDRKETAKALNQEAFELRATFVRGFRLNTKAQYGDFYELCMREVMEWRNLTSGMSYYRSPWDSLTLRRMLAIPYEPDRDKEETLSHELERRGVHRASFLLAWALCGGITGVVRDDDGWCNAYNGAWKPCEDLDAQYRLLTSLGYEMSDFERSLQDKTHEFFKEDAPQ